MPGGLRNQPKIMRGAFVEYGLSMPPLVVGFQFNPLQLARNHTLTFSAPAEAQTMGNITLRDFHQCKEFSDLNKLREAQQVSIDPETLSFDIRLDATDKLNEGDFLTERFGIAPQLATLERMVEPKNEGLIGKVLDRLLPGEFSFTGSKKPPMILFVWGRKRILPVNINSMQIIETEFSADLDPLRATVAVSLTVIEGPNAVYRVFQLRKETLSAIHQTRLAIDTFPSIARAVRDPSTIKIGDILR
jgi:Contractile injection system tube protein